MDKYGKSSHTVYDLKYHIVWITIYSKPVLFGEVSKRVRDLIREICKSTDVEIVKGHISRDHVHLFVSVPPHISVSKLVQSLKGKTSRKLMSEYKRLSREFWGCHIWARGYFVVSSGQVTEDIIKKYIEAQGKEIPDGDFQIDE